jgi:hypothetical protein
VAITLDVNDSSQVASASLLQFDTGVANQQAVIFSGIAIPSFGVHDDSTIARDTVIVNLRFTVLAVVQATISLGLASISNDDSSFLFATDAASLAIDNTTQELLLQVNAAVSGDPSALLRFGYQVVVIAGTQVTGISGTIRFGKDVFDASKITTGQEQQLFLVSADTQTVLPPPPGGSFGQIQNNPVAFGTITGMSVSGNDFNVTYNIPGAPYNQQLFVIVQAGPLFTPSQQTSTGQTGGPSPVVLTVAQPSVSGVDFRIVKFSIR